MMTWFGWIFLTLEALGTVIMVETENDPTKRAIALVTGVLLILGVLFVGTGHL